MQPKEQAYDLIARSQNLAEALQQAVTQEQHAMTMKRPTNVGYWGEVIVDIRKVQTTAGLQVVLSNVGNPDHRQDPEQPLPGVLNRIVAAKDLAEASNLCRAYIEENDLGGGNWSGGLVLKDGNEFAKVSYNGRVWGLPQRTDDKPIWPVPTEQETHAKKQVVEGVEPLEFESAIVEMPGYGQIQVSGCYRVAHCSTIAGKFAIDGRRMDFTTYFDVARDGRISDLQSFNLHPDGLTETQINAPKKIRDLVTKTLREWASDPANAAMFLRNQFADERHSLQVMERNIRYAERDLEEKRKEADAKRAAVETLRLEIDAPAPGPKF
jgi:hypothetical protein